MARFSFSHRALHYHVKWRWGHTWIRRSKFSSATIAYFSHHLVWPFKVVSLLIFDTCSFHVQTPICVAVIISWWCDDPSSPNERLLARLFPCILGCGRRRCCSDVWTTKRMKPGKVLMQFGNVIRNSKWMRTKRGSFKTFILTNADSVFLYRHKTRSCLGITCNKKTFMISRSFHNVSAAKKQARSFVVWW